MPICTLADMQACFSLSQLVVGASCGERIGAIGSAISPALTQGVIAGSAAAGVAKTPAIGQNKIVASARRATDIADIEGSSQDDLRASEIKPALSFCVGHYGACVRAISPYGENRHGPNMSSMLRASCVAAAMVLAAFGAVPQAGADPLADLMKMLPAGYSSNSCKPADSKGALAAVNCRDNSLPGGPTDATYWLFGDDKGMNDAFTAYLKRATWAPATCPGAQSSDAIAVVGSKGKQYGLIACGRGTGTDWQVRDGAVAWTRDVDHFFGVAYVGYQGQGYPATLFEWVRAQEIQRDCAASGGTYSAWSGDAEIHYSECCFEDANHKKVCDEYVDGTYQGRPPG